jgi:hypothetical protein
VSFKSLNLPRLVMAAVLGASAGCLSANPGFLPAPERDLGSTLERARAMASNGQVARADSLLVEYVASNQGSRQALEAQYWRSVLQLQAPEPGVGIAIPLLNTYVAAGQTTDHWLEAEALLRAAMRLDTLSRERAALSRVIMTSNGEVVSANAKAADAKADAKAAIVDTKELEAEIRRLKDELAKSKDELERIKKRLAEPPKKPPVR